MQTGPDGFVEQCILHQTRLDVFGQLAQVWPKSWNIENTSFAPNPSGTGLVQNGFAPNPSGCASLFLGSPLVIRRIMYMNRKTIEFLRFAPNLFRTGLAQNLYFHVLRFVSSCVIKWFAVFMICKRINLLIDVCTVMLQRFYV